ncbi:MAG: ATP-binding protein [Candidatus Coatesbacteria bacterium]|nr:ATP-binding protein [Candidatus Coatesbacteria bacterium]
MNDNVVFSQKLDVEGGDFIRGGESSCRILEILKELAFPPAIVRRAGIAAYEAEMNIVMYADRGTMDLKVTPDRITIIIQDEGPGIEDIELAMQEGYSTATDKIREMGFGAGMGLPNIKKNSDEMEITSTVGRGTRISIVITTNGGDSRDADR